MGIALGAPEVRRELLASARPQLRAVLKKTWRLPNRWGSVCGGPSHKRIGHQSRCTLTDQWREFPALGIGRASCSAGDGSFVMLVLGLLTTILVALLLLNTALAENSFQLNGIRENARDLSPSRAGAVWPACRCRIADWT